jgi:hypothetical protein
VLCCAHLSGDTVQSFLQSVPHSCGLSDRLGLCYLLLLRARRGSDGRRTENGGREVVVRRGEESGRIREVRDRQGVVM